MERYLRGSSLSSEVVKVNYPARGAALFIRDLDVISRTVCVCGGLTQSETVSNYRLDSILAAYDKGLNLRGSLIRSGAFGIPFEMSIRRFEIDALTEKTE